MNSEYDTLGRRIAKARKAAGLSQAQLAEELDVSFQAVSLWENDKTLPDTANLIQAAKVLGVSVSFLSEERFGQLFETRDNIFEWEHMAAFIRHTARAYGMHDTLKALDFALQAHEGQKRKKSDIPYIYHPLNMACHCFALKIKDDALVSATLLHDVVEDCGCTCEQLPVSEEARKLVGLLSHPETIDSDRKAVMDEYFKKIALNPKACLIKCIDRCNNLTTMSWGLSRERIYRYIADTETYFPTLLQRLKDEPEYYDAAWLLKYQIESMLEIYKRLM